MDKEHRTVFSIFCKGINLFRTYKKDAFTLSEVLITLLVIGIIAILVVPNVVTNYRTKTWDTTSDKFSSELAAATYEMVQTGKMDGYATTRDFIDELTKHMPLRAICDSNHLTDCFTEQFYSDGNLVNTADIKTSINFGKRDYNTEVIGFRTNFGVNGLIAYDSRCATSAQSKVQKTGCVSYIIDTNDLKRPNKTKQDIRMANVRLKLQSLTDCPGVTWNNRCVWLTNTSDPSQQIPPIDCRESNSSSQDYIDYCGPTPSNFETDYWAGGKKRCAENGMILADFNTMKNFFANYKNENPEVIVPFNYPGGIAYSSTEDYCAGVTTLPKNCAQGTVFVYDGINKKFFTGGSIPNGPSVNGASTYSKKSNTLSWGAFCIEE